MKSPTREGKRVVLIESIYPINLCLKLDSEEAAKRLISMEPHKKIRLVAEVIE